MKNNNRTLRFTVTLTVPVVATVYQVREYIVAAVERWGGFNRREDPLFSGRIKHVKVKHEGDSGKREPTGPDLLDLSDLISRLQVVESQIRVAGNIPKDMPIKVPVKVSEGFGLYRHGITHITAKPGYSVLLHITREV